MFLSRVAFPPGMDTGLRLEQGRADRLKGTVLLYDLEGLLAHEENQSANEDYFWNSDSALLEPPSQGVIATAGEDHLAEILNDPFFVPSVLARKKQFEIVTH